MSKKTRIDRQLPTTTSKPKTQPPNCSTVTVSEKGRESQTTASQTDHLHRLADQRATVPRCVPVSSTGHVHTTEGEGIGFFFDNSVRVPMACVLQGGSAKAKASFVRRVNGSSNGVCQNTPERTET